MNCVRGEKIILYPEKYNNHEFCYWRITAPTGTKVALQFTEFDTEGDHDIFEIYNGVDSEGSLLHSISGGNVNDIINGGNKMYLSFLSDGSNTRSGFRGVLTYFRSRLKLMYILDKRYLTVRSSLNFKQYL